MSLLKKKHYDKLQKHDDTEIKIIHLNISGGGGRSFICTSTAFILKDRPEVELRLPGPQYPPRSLNYFIPQAQL